MMPKAVDVLIIGAGPAGLAASLELNRRSVRTVIVDEYPTPGGRLLGQLYEVHGRGWNGRQVAEQFMHDIDELGQAEWLMGTSVVGIQKADQHFRVTLTSGVMIAKVVLVATGATEVPLMVADWTLPGVMSVGAAQVMANVHGVKPGERGIIIGGGPLAFTVAQELQWLGIPVSAIVMAPAPPNQGLKDSLDEQWQSLTSLLHLAPAWLRAAKFLLRDERSRAHIMARAPRRGIAVSGTRLYPHVVATAIHGTDQVESVAVRRIGSRGTWVGPEEHIKVDFVAISGGLRPIPDLFQAAGAAIQYSRGGLFDIPLFGPFGETTVPGLYAAGNALGIEGALVALAQGRAAAHGMYHFLRGIHGPSADDEAQALTAIGHARADTPLVFSHRWAEVQQQAQVAWEHHRREREDAF